MQIEKIKQSVQRNCDIIDASHAQDYGLCVYLLRMRGHYRWKKGFSFTEEIVEERIKEWILDTEEFWDRLQGEPYAEISMGDVSFDPFEANQINDQLIGAGYVYGGGFSYGGIPLFFLAELERVEERFGFEILISDREIARGLWGAPALVNGNRVIVRKETMKQLLWSRYDEWDFNKLDNPMKKALAYYSFDKNPEAAIDQMTEVELETLIQHEIGEGLIGREFGEEWQKMLRACLNTKTEYLLRAIKDLAVDCMTTLPFLINMERESSIHLFFAIYSDLRKELYPALYHAYQNWNETNSYRQLNQLIEKGKILWFDTGKQVLEMYERDGADSFSNIEDFLKKNLNPF